MSPAQPRREEGEREKAGSILGGGKGWVRSPLAGVTQVVRVSDCDSERRGFKSRPSPSRFSSRLGLKPFSPCWTPISFLSW